MFGWKFESSQPHQSHFVPLIFHWFLPELPNRSLGNAKECVKLRDDQTGRVVTWPHWRG